jgi:hypothetical protein
VRRYLSRLVLWSAVFSVGASLASSAPVLAGTTFNDSFSGSALDGTLWNTSIATGGVRFCPDGVDSPTGTWVDVTSSGCSGLTAAAPYGAISVGGGVASVSAPSGSVYPYVYAGSPSRPDPFPATGGFVFSARMRFDAIGGFGAGLQVVSSPNTNPTGTNGTGQAVLALWNGDVSLLGAPWSSLPDPSSFHDYRLQYVAGTYRLYIDGALAAGPVSSTLRPNAIWFGNPAAVWWGQSDWTTFTLDSIAVTVSSFLDLTVDPNPAPVGQMPTISGRLTLLDGAAAGGKSVAISATPPGGSPQALTTVTTAADGSFSYSDPTALNTIGDWTFDASWVGNATYQPAAAEVTDPVSLSGSALTTTASPNPALAGDAVTISGSLSLSGAGTPGGRTLQIFGTPLGGSEQQLGQATTQADGSYSFLTSDLTGPVATWHIRVAWAGDATHQPAEAGTDVAINRRADTISLVASAKTVRYGHALTLTAHLAAWHTNTAVSIYAIPYGGVRRLVTSAAVDSNGNLSVRVTPKKDTTYIAQYAGDDWYATASAKRAVLVAVIAGITQSGWYGTLGGYRLYHYHSSCATSGSSCPAFTGTVTPNHAGHTLTFTLQLHSSTGWKTVATARPRIGKRGSVTVYIRYGSTAIEGHSYRVRDTFAGDADHVGSLSHWAYFRITR